jgi:hypothetical protein
VGIRSHFETYSREVRILAEIERVARDSDDINAIRVEHYERYYAQMADERVAIAASSQYPPQAPR